MEVPKSAGFADGGGIAAAFRELQIRVPNARPAPLSCSARPGMQYDALHGRQLAEVNILDIEDAAKDATVSYMPILS